MSKVEDKNWLLARIVASIERLNCQRGSRVSEIMAEIEHENPSQGDSKKFDMKCDRFREAFCYGVRLGVLVHDCNMERYKLAESASKVGRFLQTMEKQLSPQIPGWGEIWSDPQPIERDNGHVIDPHYFRLNESSDSDNEIV